MPCSCGHDDWRTPPTRENFLEYMRWREIGAQLELIKADGSKWMSVYRCTVCGGIWVEDYMDSGQASMAFYYAIDTDDPIAWLERAKNLF
jgi:hypothetical protein